MPPARRPHVSVPAARAAARLARQVERALAPAGLSLPQYRLLALLDDADELASSLAGLLAVRPPSVTAVVDGLVQRHLVERRPSDSDRRCVTHVLTAAGRDALSDGDAAVADRLATLVLHLPDDETRAALAGLEGWGQALDAAREARRRPAGDPARSPAHDPSPSASPGSAPTPPPVDRPTTVPGPGTARG